MEDTLFAQITPHASIHLVGTKRRKLGQRKTILKKQRKQEKQIKEIKIKLEMEKREKATWRWLLTCEMVSPFTSIN